MSALQRLLPAMLPQIDLPRALLRGRYMAAAAAMEHNGVPIDMATLALLRTHWTDIQDELIGAIDDHGIYDGRTFKLDRWARFLAAQDIPWPRFSDSVNGPPRMAMARISSFSCAPMVSSPK